jgi:hypothetical protein
MPSTSAISRRQLKPARSVIRIEVRRIVAGSIEALPTFCSCSGGLSASSSAAASRMASSATSQLRVARGERKWMSTG